MDTDTTTGDAHEGGAAATDERGDALRSSMRAMAEASSQEAGTWAIATFERALRQLQVTLDIEDPIDVDDLAANTVTRGPRRGHLRQDKRMAIYQEVAALDADLATLVAQGLTVFDDLYGDRWGALPDRAEDAVEHVDTAPPAHAVPVAPAPSAWPVEDHQEDDGDDHERDIAVTRIWRHADENIALIEYDETIDGHLQSKKAHDKSWPPSTGFTEAFDALYPYIAGPYLVSASFHHRVKPREVTLEYPEGGEQKTKLHGTIEPDGFDGATVHLRVPKQATSGKLLAAIAVLVREAKAYIDGRRGSEPLFGGRATGKPKADAAQGDLFEDRDDEEEDEDGNPYEEDDLDAEDDEDLDEDLGDDLAAPIDDLGDDDLEDEDEDPPIEDYDPETPAKHVAQDEAEAWADDHANAQGAAAEADRATLG